MVTRSQHQPSTPVTDSESAEKSVSVTDPRHPLFGRTLPLIKFLNHSRLGRCCQVRVEGDKERMIPLHVTDLAAEQKPLYPLPLDPMSLEQLIKTYLEIYDQLEGSEDE